MKFSDPQLIYMVMVLSSLFGLTLVGEGLNKVIKSEKVGVVSIFFGVLFILLAVGAYFLIGSVR